MAVIPIDAVHLEPQLPNILLRLTTQSPPAADLNTTIRISLRHVLPVPLISISGSNSRPLFLATFKTRSSMPEDAFEGGLLWPYHSPPMTDAQSRASPAVDAGRSPSRSIHARTLERTAAATAARRSGSLARPDSPRTQSERDHATLTSSRHPPQARVPARASFSATSRTPSAAEFVGTRSSQQAQSSHQGMVLPAQPAGSLSRLPGVRHPPGGVVEDPVLVSFGPFGSPACSVQVRHLAQTLIAMTGHTCVIVAEA